MKERQPMSIYRHIYEQHFGPIPVDEEGRTYDIHHKDGNRKNNDPKNLVALSIDDHYNVHYDQNDWSACLRIIARKDVSPDLLSDLATKSNLKRSSKGINPFQNKNWASEREKKRWSKGNHPASRPDVIAKRKKRQKEVIQDLVSKGEYYSQSEKHKEHARMIVEKMISEGTHTSCIKKECPYCGRLISKNGYSQHIKTHE